MIVDFIATKPHYLDHLAPVWHALRPEERGGWLMSESLWDYAAAWHNIYAHDRADFGHGDWALAAGYVDLNGMSTRRCVLMEHGVGQSYGDDRRQNYAGGPNRGHVAVFLSVNEIAHQKNTEANPDAWHFVIGSPRMDAWFNKRPYAAPHTAVSFHFPINDWVPETQTALPHYKSAVAELHYQHGDLIGHEHPRWDGRLLRQWDQIGMPTCWHFPSLVDRAYLYICDNSSTIYEWAALDRPVVLLNAPQYRRDVEMGIRFWEYADVGVQCNDPDLLASCVDIAIERADDYTDRRAEITAALFPYQGRSADRAVEALRSLS